MNGKVTCEPRWSSPFFMTMYAVAALLFSLFVLMNNQVYLGFRQEGSPAAWLFQTGGAVLIALLCLAVASMGLVNEGRMRLPYLLSWALYAPSLISLSNIDWFQALDVGYDLGSVHSALPGWVIFANGAVILGGELLLRCYRHWSDLGKGLVSEGADAAVTGTALDRALLHNAIRIGLSLAFALAVFSVLPLLSHSFEVLGYNIGRGYNYLALPIAAAFLILMLYLTFGLRPGKGDDGRPSRPL